jgi:hypothetical protein
VAGQQFRMQDRYEIGKRDVGPIETAIDCGIASPTVLPLSSAMTRPAMACEYVVDHGNFSNQVTFGADAA